MPYKERNSGFLSEMEQNTFSNANQRNVPNVAAVQNLGRTMTGWAGLDISDPPAEISRVCNLSCPIFPSKHHEPLKGEYKQDYDCLLALIVFWRLDNAIHRINRYQIHLSTFEWTLLAIKWLNPENFAKKFATRKQPRAKMKLVGFFTQKRI